MKPDELVDDAAIEKFRAEYGQRAQALPEIAIIIPAFNEGGSIGAVIDALPAQIAGLNARAIIIVDGATDNTAREARAHGAMVCDVACNRGQGAALRLGYRIAREGGASYILTTDADGQYEATEADNLFAPILSGEADFVSGSRRLGSERTKDPIRKLGVRFFAWLISFLTGTRITDPAFGLRAMRTEVTAKITLSEPQYQAAELLIGAIASGFRITERPATINPRHAGKTKKGNDIFYGIQFARVVLKTWWKNR